MGVVASGRDAVGRAEGADSAAPSPRAPLRTDLLIYTALVLLVSTAWWISVQGWFTSWSRLGYWLGVAGGVSMLLLFTYPIRKRWRVTYGWGQARHWFLVHMVLGVLGPWLILLHSTFHIGSTNAAVALFSMIIVALSGVVGRFLYVRLHADLRGQKATLADFSQRLKAQHEAADLQLVAMPEVLEALHRFEDQMLGETVSFWRVLSLPFARRQLVRHGKAMVKRGLKQDMLLKRSTPAKAATAYANAARQIAAYAEAVQRAAQFRTFERLFSLWHVAHVPFVWVMVLCAIFHVVAVHAY